MAWTYATTRTLRFLLNAGAALLVLWVALFLTCVFVLPEAMLTVFLFGIHFAAVFLVVSEVLNNFHHSASSAARNAEKRERDRLRVDFIARNPTAGETAVDAFLRSPKTRAYIATEGDAAYYRHYYCAPIYSSLGVAAVALVIAIADAMLLVFDILTYYNACTPWPAEQQWIIAVVVAVDALLLLHALWLLFIVGGPVWVSRGQRNRRWRHDHVREEVCHDDDRAVVRYEDSISGSLSGDSDLYDLAPVYH